MEYQKIAVDGVLRTQDKEYWLCAPHPIELDSWMRDRERAFYVVPRLDHLVKKYDKNVQHNGLQCLVTNSEFIYPYPRHIVISGDYTIEYLTDLSIKVRPENRTNPDKIKNKGVDKKSNINISPNKGFAIFDMRR